VVGCRPWYVQVASRASGQQNAAPGEAGKSGKHPSNEGFSRGITWVDPASTPREDRDHATPYLQRIFRGYWGADAAVVVAELTLADVDPTMAELRPLAAESLARAHELAAETAREHAAKPARVA
jgi:FMN-dependent NADH-azoreductase